MGACTALILEDSPLQARIIGQMIEAQGWSTIHCASLVDATEKLKHTSVQALFLDVYVGMFNTITNIDQFRALAPMTPIVIMTAGSGKEAIEDTLKRARQANADHVLSKPFTDAQLIDVLDLATRDLQSGARRMHALIIDDSKTVRNVACRMFESANFRVSQACTMEDAFDNVDIARVDLILCDIFMPGMAGFKGMRMIKKIWPKVRIIAMSGGIENKVSGEDVLSAARVIGADAQIKKPFTSESLLDLVDMLFRQVDLN
jgi:CheY-like chemotaxis protein